MLFRKKLFIALFGASVSLGLVACNHDDNGTSSAGLTALNDDPPADDIAQDSGTNDVPQDSNTDENDDDKTDTITPGSSSNNARSIVITFPETESIENMGGGIYRRVGMAMVADEDGRPVPDGTEVHLKIIDSIMAKGVISTTDGDSISGKVLTDNNPTLADGTLTTLDTAYVIRNEAHYFIGEGDHLFLKDTNGSQDHNNNSNAEPADKARQISSEEGAVAGNTLTVTDTYSMDYPNNIYPSGTTDYIVGASLLGAKIVGVQDGEEESDANSGYATTKDGNAKFYVYYPANLREINSGCVRPEIDERSYPLGSAKVVLAASVGTEVVTLDDRFCFEPAAPYTLTHEPNLDVAPGASFVDAGVVVTLEDVNKIGIPYEEPLWEYSTTDSVELSVDNVSFSSSHTDRYGQVTVYVSATASVDAKSGDTITITIRAGDASTQITVSVI